MNNINISRISLQKIFRKFGKKIFKSSYFIKELSTENRILLEFLLVCFTPYSFVYRSFGFGYIDSSKYTLLEKKKYVMEYFSTNYEKLQQEEYDEIKEILNIDKIKVFHKVNNNTYVIPSFIRGNLFEEELNTEDIYEKICNKYRIYVPEGFTSINILNMLYSMEEIDKMKEEVKHD